MKYLAIISLLLLYIPIKAQDTATTEVGISIFDLAQGNIVLEYQPRIKVLDKNIAFTWGIVDYNAMFGGSIDVYNDLDIDSLSFLGNSIAGSLAFSIGIESLFVDELRLWFCPETSYKWHINNLWYVKFGVQQYLGYSAYLSFNLYIGIILK